MNKRELLRNFFKSDLYLEDYHDESSNDFEINCDNQIELQLGDYLSFGRNYGGDYILTQVTKVEDNYILMNIDTLENEFQTFSSMDEISDIVLNGYAIPYYADQTKQTLLEEDELPNTLYRYLVYDKNHGGDFEVIITYDGLEDMYNIMTPTLDDYFYEESFDFFHEAFIRLYKDYSLVKRLRN